MELGFQVTLDTGPEDARTPAQMLTAEACANLIDDAREYAFQAAGAWLVLQGDPKGYPVAAEYVMKVWFSHNSIRKGEEPPRLYHDLADSTLIVIKLDEFEGLDPAVECFAPLIGGSVTTILKRGQ
jgi:hypothetical protein